MIVSSESVTNNELLIAANGSAAGSNWGYPHHATASDFGMYNSFSGADIKVIVHFPKNNESIKQLKAKKAEVSSRAAALVEALEFSTTPEELNRFNSSLNATFNELASLDEALHEADSAPTAKTLGEIQTLSWSIYREKSPVRTLGSNYPRAYTRGGRTIGGSMVFTIFQQHVLHDILELGLGLYNTGTTDFDRYRYTTVLPDQLPPLDISLIFANEFGAISHMGLWGVEFVQEGGTFSIEDIFSESVVQYVARDIDPMKIVQQRKVDGQGVTTEWTRTASSLSDEHKQLYGYLYRRNPFL